jgi:hypothetical protein
LDFEKTLKFPIHRCNPARLPKFALWSEGILKKTGYGNKYYVCTDCDVVPDCPDDWMFVLKKALDLRPKFPKAALGLRIDDLPDCYDRKKAVIRWERQFCSPRRWTQP